MPPVLLSFDIGLLIEATWTFVAWRSFAELTVVLLIEVYPFALFVLVLGLRLF